MHCSHPVSLSAAVLASRAAASGETLLGGAPAALRSADGMAVLRVS